VSDDDKYSNDSDRDEPVRERKFAHDARFDEAIGLIDACRQDEPRKAKYRSELRASKLLETLDISTRHSDASRAVEDAAAVVAAYAAALEMATPGAPRNASVRKVLEKVLEQAEKIEAARRKIIAALDVEKNAAVSHARMLLEETALEIAASRCLMPVDSKLPVLRRTAKQIDRARLLTRPLSAGMLTRHGLSTLSRIKRPPPEASPPEVSPADGVAAAQRHGLSAELGKPVTDIVNKIFEMLVGEGMNSLLLETARISLKSFGYHSELSAHIVPPANIILAVGALELFCAWQPKRRPTTSEYATRKPTTSKPKKSIEPVAVLIDILRVASSPDKETGDTPREALLAVVATWKLGRAALLFDGCDPTRQKRRDFLLKYKLNAAYGDTEFGEL
jgi:hypothetical protein